MLADKNYIVSLSIHRGKNIALANIRLSFAIQYNSQLIIIFIFNFTFYR